MPITSGAVNSSIKQFNQRALRSGHLRLEGGAAAILHTRAAYLPDDLAWGL